MFERKEYAPTIAGSSRMNAPPDQLAACLEVLYHVALEVRVLAWGNSASFRQRLRRRRRDRIADLMDAIHNIPVLLRCWDKCDVELLRAFLVSCDDRYPEATYRLAEIYDRALEQAQTEAVGARQA